LDKIKGNGKKIKFISCEVILDEVKELLPGNWEVTSVEKRLHERSDELREKLQEEIDRSEGFDIIFLGFGLCGKSVEGLTSKDATLVLPKSDDCIAILLGSVEEYKKQTKKEPGTYYLTRGYIGEAEEDVVGGGFSEIREKYDEDTWKWIIKEMLKNYTRLAFINTGNYDPEKWRQMAKEEAKKLDLEFEEIKSTGDFFQKISNGQWDGDFITIKPGQKITAGMFANN
jgi:Icc-related predicted phosphoesterase